MKRLFRVLKKLGFSNIFAISLIDSSSLIITEINLINSATLVKENIILEKQADFAKSASIFSDTPNQHHAVNFIQIKFIPIEKRMILNKKSDLKIFKKSLSSF